MVFIYPGLKLTCIVDTLGFPRKRNFRTAHKKIAKKSECQMKSDSITNFEKRKCETKQQNRIDKIKSR